jgi:tetratricopeptide (TPR) repeat protein
VPGPYDLFISFHRGCAEPIKRLSAALEKLGIAFCAIDGTSPDNAELPAALPESKALLAWGSEEYFRSRGCQNHLAAAFIAREAAPAGHAERVLIVNAVAGVKHIYPVHLRDLQFASAPGLPDAPDFTELAEWLREHCAALPDTLGELGARVRSGWLEAFDSVSAAAPRFEGRERELWDIHAAVCPRPPAATPGDTGPVVVVSGAAGQGKSLLAREYAFRFGSAYPGGILRLAAGTAQPTVSFAELAENPPLKKQLAALLRKLAPDADPEGLTVPALRERLGELLASAGKPFLWIVDDLPDGLNGPAFRQWLAPDSAGPLGHSLVTTRSRRYDGRAEAIHLPPLDEYSALGLLLRDSPPLSESDREAVDWLLEDLGREARAMAMAGALADLERRNRRGPYAALWKQIEGHGREAADLAVRFPEEFPQGHEATVAALLLSAIEALEEPGRNLLRLAGELADATLPAELVAECFFASGLNADEQRVRSFAIFITEPAVEPVTVVSARAHAEAGMAALERLCLAERSDGGVRVHPVAARVMARSSADPMKRAALHGAALQVLYGIAERCVAEGDWQALVPLAAHAHVLVGDLRNRPIDPAEDPAEVKRRVRLFLCLADLDVALGARQQAMQAYRGAAAFLVRAMNADPHNGSRQRDFARAQERIGDLLAAQDDLPGALDRFRKSLGIRAYLAKQDPDGPERQRDLLRHHHKIGAIQSQRGDVEGALQSYRAAHRILDKLSGDDPTDAELRFELGASYERLAGLYVRLGDAGSALGSLHPALSIYEGLAQAHPEQLPFQRAPVAIHNMVGDLLRGHADLSGALDRYRTALSIAARLAEQDPVNPDVQRDLALCHNNIGNVLTGLEDSEGAAVHYRAYLAIGERLAAEEPARGARQRELAVGYMKLGMAIEHSETPAEALEQYRKAGAILERLAAVTPNNEVLRKDLAWVRERIGKLSSEESRTESV